MFYGCEMTFDGRSCTEYGLMMYDFKDAAQTDVDFTSSGKLITEHVPGQYETMLYGTDQETPLKFTLVLCANEESVNKGEFLDRFDISDIASWLTGHQTYKWLSIDQPDMRIFRYKCLITELRLLTHGNLPWAFACTVTCDSPYAYMTPITYAAQATTSGYQLIVNNRSTHNGYYYPNIVIDATGSNRDISIINQSDKNREFRLTGIPSISKNVVVDNLHQIIVDKSSGLNLYPYFNYKFLRMVRGSNTFILKGDFTLTIKCEFPVNIGG